MEKDSSKACFDLRQKKKISTKYWIKVNFYADGDDVETAKLLIENGANVTIKDKYEETPLHKTAYHGKCLSLTLNLFFNNSYLKFLYAKNDFYK